MPGRLVDVGGHRLHLSCTGSGSPTVVLEAGGGAMAANLGWITPAVAHDTTICVYDRAGRGWSEDADAPQDAVAISTDLHTLLQRAGVPGPYVIAGHSFGGLYALDLRGPATPTRSPAWCSSTPPPPLRRGRRGAATRRHPGATTWWAGLPR